MDMLEGGLAWEEVTSLAKALEASGADVISTHFCWHESQVPTIATMVPRAAFAHVTGRLREAVSIPLITSNRINMPHVAEEVLARGDADLISMARPMLADAELVNKAWEGREDEINTCIACKQACLDHTFTGQEPARGLYDELLVRGLNAQLIGGAFEAVELDAKRAILQVTELAVAVLRQIGPAVGRHSDFDSGASRWQLIV
jgi:NADPH-dependent 2,4-dienoyl-CoA reductase/sulfur reductase-like enzyme